jgi:peroxiredoxin Q/BCP
MAAKKKTTTKAPARKPAVKKAPAKKAPPRKAPAKKAAGKRAPAKKAPAKKALAKKTPAKRAPAKKAPANAGGKKAPAKASAGRRTAAKAPPAAMAQAETGPAAGAQATTGEQASGNASSGGGETSEGDGGGGKPMLTEGQAAPAFRLVDQDEKPVTLADLRGKNVVLYFYPKDSTPGCTLEGQHFSRLAPEFAAKNTVVFGVSADGAASHRKFKAKCAIDVPLLADPEKQAIQAFGAWQEKSMYGRKMMGIVRSTFLLDGEGKVRKVWPKVKVEGHAEDVLAAI